MDRVLIIEPLCEGHHANYAWWSAAAFRQKGHAVQIATLEKSASRLSSLERGQKTTGPIELLELPDAALSAPDGFDTFALVRKELAYWRLFRRFYLRSMATFAPDLVFVPYTDYCVNAIAIKGSPFGSTAWAGVVMRPSFHLRRMGIVGPHPSLGTAKERLLKRLLGNRQLRTLFTIDETLYAYWLNTYPQTAIKLGYLPDPAELSGHESKDHARKSLGLRKNSIILLVYGDLCLRKGVAELLSAARQPDFPREVDILLAGRQDQALSELLKSPRLAELIEHRRLHQINHFLTRDEEFRVFAAADIVWMGYRGHLNMSGVLVQAGQMGLPVVACREGLVGWLVREHNLGITVDTRDGADVVRAINRLVKDPPGARIFGQSAKATFASHTPDVFCRALTDRLEADGRHISACSPAANRLI